ncbi:hypothetical protein CEXT_494151 [Caerostris extrusa]|uniref:Uncharacterized protein n=1 Tax=Caerostris extrusa TaxID=172846 RepID=A0AAV4SNY5_CAEEX|nr:hypothetical protein CEXT_494151 [Caerostris extrusa]
MPYIPQVSADSIPPPYPKRPPPMPPNKPPSGHDLHRTNQHRSPDSSSLRKPIPPPKPKTRLQSVLAKLPLNETPNSNGEPREDNEDDIRPSSPVYVVPNVHVLPLVARKKFSEARCNRTAEKKRPQILAATPGRGLDPENSFIAGLPTVGLQVQGALFPQRSGTSLTNSGATTEGQSPSRRKGLHVLHTEVEFVSEPQFPAAQVPAHLLGTVERRRRNFAE